MQTLAQHDHLYGTAARGVLDSFSSKLFFGGGLGQTDAKLASELAGTCTVASVAVTRTYDPFGGDRISKTKAPAARPVLPPEEVARPHVHPLPGRPATLFVHGRPPFLAYFPSAFEQPIMSACLKVGFDIEANLRTARKRQDLTQLKDDRGWQTLSGAA